MAKKKDLRCGAKGYELNKAYYYDSATCIAAGRDDML